MKIYLVCSVRNCTVEQQMEADTYVATMESNGHQVHYPPRDVNQNDPTGGIQICKAHRAAIEACDEVHILWDGNSKGSHFDLGMAWALRKQVKLVNKNFPDVTGKSYLKVIQGWDIS